MFFSRLFKKIRSRPGKKSIKARSAAIDQPASNITNLTTKNQLNKSLKKVNNAIQNQGPTNQLLLQKSDILLKKGKLRQASQLLNKLSRIKDDSDASNTAKQLLLRANQLRNGSPNNKTEFLFKALREHAANYKQELNNLPQTIHKASDLEITQLVRREARRARSGDLPKLSLDLIELTLQAGHENPWILHDKALTLYMMGQHLEALKILNNLATESKGEKIKMSIIKNIEEITYKPNRYKSKINYYLTKEAILLAKSQALKLQLIPELSKIKPTDKIKPLIFKEARNALKNTPEATLILVNLILDYFPGDLATLQLKGEALASLKESDKAIQIWKNLSHSENTKVATKASESIGQIIAKKAKAICAKKSPRAAILHYIQQNFDHDLSPTLNEEVENILSRINPPGNELTEPELRKHHFQLQLNTLVIEYFETLLRDKGRLNNSAPAQKPGSIGKTAPKVG